MRLQIIVNAARADTSIEVPAGIEVGLVALDLGEVELDLLLGCRAWMVGLSDKCVFLVEVDLLADWIVLGFGSFALAVLRKMVLFEMDCLAFLIPVLFYLLPHLYCLFLCSPLSVSILSHHLIKSPLPILLHQLVLLDLRLLPFLSVLIMSIHPLLQFIVYFFRVLYLPFIYTVQIFLDLLSLGYFRGQLWHLF